MDKSKFNVKKEWRNFGIGLSVILAIIATIQLYFDNKIYLYLYLSALIILFFSFVLPIVIKPIFILFSYIGFGMGWVMTRVILSLLFYLLFTPLGLMLRLFGKQFLDIKFKDGKESHWIDVADENHNPQNYENQY